MTMNMPVSGNPVFDTSTYCIVFVKSANLPLHLQYCSDTMCSDIDIGKVH